MKKVSKFIFNKKSGMLFLVILVVINCSLFKIFYSHEKTPDLAIQKYMSINNINGIVLKKSSLNVNEDVVFIKDKDLECFAFIIVRKFWNKRFDVTDIGGWKSSKKMSDFYYVNAMWSNTHDKHDELGLYFGFMPDKKVEKIFVNGKKASVLEIEEGYIWFIDNVKSNSKIKMYKGNVLIVDNQLS